MWGWLRAEIEKLTGARRFAAGAVALYIAAWVAEATLTFFWDKLLERQAPMALRQMSGLLATDLATGMALMALLVLFVPPISQFLFEMSARLSRSVELRSKRLSQREYLDGIARESISLARKARAISVQDRWDYLGDGSFDHLPPDEAHAARMRLRDDQERNRGVAMQNFVVEYLGRANFLQKQFVEFGYAREVPHVFEIITNKFCLDELATTLETSAHKVQAELRRDGYNISDANGLIATDNDESAQLR